MHTETQAHTYKLTLYLLNAHKCTLVSSGLMHHYLYVPLNGFAFAVWSCGERFALLMFVAVSPFLIISPEPYVMDSIIKGTLAIF